jgi:hypothetical protein
MRPCGSGKAGAQRIRAHGRRAHGTKSAARWASTEGRQSRGLPPLPAMTHPGPTRTHGGGGGVASRRRRRPAAARRAVAAVAAALGGGDSDDGGRGVASSGGRGEGAASRSGAHPGALPPAVALSRRGAETPPGPPPEGACRPGGAGSVACGLPPVPVKEMETAMATAIMPTPPKVPHTTAAAFTPLPPPPPSLLPLPLPLRESSLPPSDSCPPRPSPPSPLLPPRLLRVRGPLTSSPSPDRPPTTLRACAPGCGGSITVGEGGAEAPALGDSTRPPTPSRSVALERPRRGAELPPAIPTPCRRTGDGARVREAAASCGVGAAFVRAAAGEPAAGDAPLAPPLRPPVGGDCPALGLAAALPAAGAAATVAPAGGEPPAVVAAAEGRAPAAGEPPGLGLCVPAPASPSVALERPFKGAAALPPALPTPWGDGCAACARREPEARACPPTGAGELPGEGAFPPGLPGLEKLAAAPAEPEAVIGLVFGPLLEPGEATEALALVPGPRGDAGEGWGAAGLCETPD